VNLVTDPAETHPPDLDGAERVRLAGQLLDSLADLSPAEAASGLAAVHSELQSALAELDRS
jgi:hypothetical protein